MSRDRMDIFLRDIREFNEMYGLPINDKPTDLGKKQLIDMASIIGEEVSEFTDIIDNWDKQDSFDNLTDISDLLGDLIVYCCTFARRWGLDIESTLHIIMKSNFSKLGDDGVPIIDERGKVMKGVNYWKPEPQIKEMIKRQIKQN